MSRQSLSKKNLEKLNAGVKTIDEADIMSRTSQSRAHRGSLVEGNEVSMISKGKKEENPKTKKDKGP